VTGRPTWIEADAAELDVLVYALVVDYAKHRGQCRACQPEPCAEFEAWRAHKAGCRACRGDAPLTFGYACQRKQALIDHNRACPRCNPCPCVRAAIGEVLDWRAARMLLTRAQVLRADVDEAAA
jgi:hypothetical protein